MPCHLLVFWISMEPHDVPLARVLDLKAGFRCPGFTRGWRPTAEEWWGLGSNYITRSLSGSPRSKRAKLARK